MTLSVSHQKLQDLLSQLFVQRFDESHHTREVQQHYTIIVNALYRNGKEREQDKD